MHQLKYILLFILVAALQLFLLNSLNLSVYIHPMLYIAFVVLLPMDIMAVGVLMCGFAMGVVMDLTTGSAGLNSAALLFTAFARPAYLRIALSKDEIKDGGIPSSLLLGSFKFLKYCIVLVFIHSLLYFSLEAATWSFFHLTMLRVILSTVVTTVLIFVFQLSFFRR